MNNATKSTEDLIDDLDITLAGGNNAHECTQADVELIPSEDDPDVIIVVIKASCHSDHPTMMTTQKELESRGKTFVVRFDDSNPCYYWGERS